MQLDLQLDAQTARRDAPSGLDPATAHARLEAAFGPLTTWWRRDPVSQLVRSLIASRTKDAVSDAVLAKLRERFRSWEALACARPEEVLQAIAPVTFPEKKAEQLPRALTAIRRRMGALRLDGLAEAPLDDAMDWLSDIPGVGQEVAASVLNASTLDRPVMIVDGHVARLAARLGWTVGEDAGAAREAIMGAAPHDWGGAEFLALHRRLKVLGQTVCRPELPTCAACPLAAGCPDGSRRMARRGERPTERRDALQRMMRRVEREGSPRARRGAVALGSSDLDAAFEVGGLPAGLHHFAPEAPGAMALAWLAPLAAAVRAPAVQGVRLVVVQEADARREGGAPYGPGLEALGLAAHALAVVRAGGAAEALGAAEAALRLCAAPAVLLELRGGEALADLTATRRLDLLARRTGAWLFLVSPTLDATSAALTRWRAGPLASQARRRRPGWPAVRLRLVRNRAGRTGEWSLVWNPHERRFTPVAPLSAPVGAPVVDRPRAPGAERVAAAA